LPVFDTKSAFNVAGVRPDNTVRVVAPSYNAMLYDATLIRVEVINHAHSADIRIDGGAWEPWPTGAPGQAASFYSGKSGIADGTYVFIECRASTDVLASYAATAFLVKDVSYTDEPVGVVSAVGGDGSYTYSDEGTSHSGLSIDPVSGVVIFTGFLAADTDIQGVWRATDGLSEFDDVIGPVEVFSAVVASYSPSASLTEGDTYSSEPVGTVSATGGAASYTYADNGGSDPGLSIDSVSGAVSYTGTPQNDTDLTGNWLVVDTPTALTDTVIGNVVVDAIVVPVSASYASNSKTLTEGVDYTDADVGTVSATGGDQNYTYTNDGGSSAGLSINSSSGAVQFNGTPASAADLLGNWRATDGQGDFDTASGPVTVNDAVAATYTPLTTLMEGTPYTDEIVGTVSALGGESSYTYSDNGGSAAGLVIDSVSGVVRFSGTPATDDDLVGNWLTTDISTSSDLVVGTVVVDALPVPVSAFYTPSFILVAGTDYSGGQVVGTVSATGGDGTYVYSDLGPTDPGLVINSTTGDVTFTGTPADDTDLTGTWLADDEAGSTDSVLGTVQVDPAAVVTPVFWLLANDFDLDGTPNANIGGTPTVFARDSSVAGFFDTYGNYQIADVNEARNAGARREENFVNNPDDMSLWAVTRLAAPVGLITDPDGGSNAWELTANDANGVLYQLNTTIPAGIAQTEWRTTWWVRRVTGTGNIDFYMPDRSYVPIGPITGSWARYDAGVASGDHTQNRFGIRIATSGDVIEVYWPRLDNVTNRNNQNPAEHSVNTVDWYKVANDVTVASTVVTDGGAGAELTTLEGLYLEGQSAQAFAAVDQYDLTGWTPTGSPGATLQANFSVMGNPSSVIDVDDVNYLHKVLPASTFGASAAIAPQFMLRQGSDTTGTLRILATNGAGEWIIDLSLLPASTAQHEKITLGHPAVAQTLAWTSAADGSSGVQIAGTSPGLLALDVAYVGLQEKAYVFSPILDAVSRGADTCYWQTVSGLSGVTNDVGFGVLIKDIQYSSAVDPGSAVFATLYGDASNSLSIVQEAAGAIILRKQTTAGGVVDTTVSGITWAAGDQLSIYAVLAADNTPKLYVNIETPVAGVDTSAMNTPIDDLILGQNSLLAVGNDTSLKWLETKTQTPPAADSAILAALALGTLP